MTPTAKVISLLEDNIDNLPGLISDNIYAYKIDNDNVDNTNVILVVSENSAGEHSFGNNDVLGTKRIIQVEFYYPFDFSEDMDLIEQSVKSFLRANGYKCYLDAGHVMSPDSENIVNTLKFNFFEEDI